MKELLEMLISKFCEDMTDEEREEFSSSFQKSSVYKDIQEEVKDMVKEYIDVLLDSHSDEIENLIKNRKFSYDEELLEVAIETLETTLSAANKMEDFFKENQSIFFVKDDKLHDVVGELSTSRDNEDFQSFCQSAWDDWSSFYKEKDVELRPVGRSQSRFTIAPDSYRKSTQERYNEMVDIRDGDSQFPTIADFFISWVVDDYNPFLSDTNTMSMPVIPEGRDVYKGYVNAILKLLKEFKQPEEIWTFAYNFYKTRCLTEDNGYNRAEAEAILNDMRINEFLQDIIDTYYYVDEEHLEQWKDDFKDLLEVNSYYYTFKDHQVENFKFFQSTLNSDGEGELSLMDNEGIDWFFISCWATARTILVKNCQYKAVSLLQELKENVMSKKNTTIEDIINFLKEKKVDYMLLPEVHFNNNDMNEEFQGYRTENFFIPVKRGENA